MFLCRLHLEIVFAMMKSLENLLVMSAYSPQTLHKLLLPYILREYYSCLLFYFYRSILFLDLTEVSHHLLFAFGRIPFHNFLQKSNYKIEHSYLMFFLIWPILSLLYV